MSKSYVFTIRFTTVLLMLTINLGSLIFCHIHCSHLMYVAPPHLQVLNLFLLFKALSLKPLQDLAPSVGQLGAMPSWYLWKFENTKSVVAEDVKCWKVTTDPFTEHGDMVPP